MFIERLNELIAEKKIPKTQFYKELGIGKNNVYYWGKGNLPNAMTINKIADYFGVTTDYLLGNSELRQKEPGTIKDSEPDNSVDDVLTRIAMKLFEGLPINDKRLAIDLIERLCGTADKK